MTCQLFINLLIFLSFGGVSAAISKVCVSETDHDICLSRLRFRDGDLDKCNKEKTKLKVDLEFCTKKDCPVCVASTETPNCCFELSNSQMSLDKCRLQNDTLNAIT